MKIGNPNLKLGMKIGKIEIEIAEIRDSVCVH